MIQCDFYNTRLSLCCTEGPYSSVNKVHFNPSLHSTLKKLSLGIRNFSKMPGSQLLSHTQSRGQVTESWQCLSARITSALEHLQHTVVLTWNCRIWKAAFSVTLISVSSASPSVISGRDREVQKKAKCQEHSTGFLSKSGKDWDCSQLAKEYRLKNHGEHKNVLKANFE